MRIFVCQTFTLICLLLACKTGSASALSPEQGKALAGKWQIRIDGGGEIYSARFNLKLQNDSSDAGLLGGDFLSDGKKAAIRSIRREDDLYVVKFNTRRRGLPVNVMFAFDLIGDRLVGDVDFDSGTSVRSYEFEAMRISSDPNKVVDGAASTKPASAVSTAETEEGKGPASTALVKEMSKETSLRRLAFQQGENGYAGTVDTEIWAIAPSKSLFRQGTLTADGNNGGGESQVLMQFGDVIGDEKGRVPQLSRIVSAKLVVVAFDPGSTIYLHRVLVPWDDSATWDSMARGISVDNVESSTVRDGFTFGEINMDKQSIEFDVTATVQKWANGEPNYGWVFVSTGSNGWDFYSCDWIEQDAHPRLEVEFESPSVSTKQFEKSSLKEARKP